MMNDVEIHIKNLSKRFKDVVALDNVSVQFASGNLYGVIGPSGAGKTTLFRIMLDLMRANSGVVQYRTGGRDVGYHVVQ